MWILPATLIGYKVLYENVPGPAFVVALVLPALYLYMATKEPDPAAAQDALKQQSRKAEQVLKELNREEELLAAKGKKKDNKKKQKGGKKQSTLDAAMASKAESSQADDEDDDEDYLARLAEQRSKKAVR